MNQNTLNQDLKNASQIDFQILNTRGDCTHYSLKADQGVFIGKSANCGIQLDDPNVSDIHCRIEFSNGVVRLQRWLSADAIHINQRLIDSESTVFVDDVIAIGCYEIRIRKQSTERQTSVTKRLSDMKTADVHPIQPKTLPPSNHGGNRSNDESMNSEENVPENAVSFPKSSVDPPTAANDSLEKLQLYLEEAMRDHESLASQIQHTEVREGPNFFPNENTLREQTTWANRNYLARSNSKKTSAKPEKTQPSDVTQLQLEIERLRIQLTETQQQNNDLQKQLVAISDRKADRAKQNIENQRLEPDASIIQPIQSTIPVNRHYQSNGSEPNSDQGTRQRRSTDPNNTKNQDKPRKLSHTAPRTTSLTTKRLSNLAIATRNSSDLDEAVTNPSEERIQALRTQLREQYKLNQNSGSILNLFTQLWK